MFEQGEVNNAFGFGNADFFQKHFDRFGRIAAPAHAGNSWHTRIIPSVDPAFFHQSQQLAFAHDRVGQIEP